MKLVASKRKQSIRQSAVYPCLLFFVLVWALAPALASSMMLRMDNSELVSRSDLVVYGVVTGVESREGTHEAVVVIEAALKGKATAGEEVRVGFSPGIEDSPIFRLGERVLLFLWKTGVKQFQTVGGFQGKFSFN